MAFVKGKSGNPKGRPKGSANQATIAARNLLAGELNKITRKAIDLALDGDWNAIKLILERLIPPVKDIPIEFKIQKIKKIDDVLEAFAKLSETLARGEITPGQAQQVASILENHRKALEQSSQSGAPFDPTEGMTLEEIEKAIAELENR